MNENENPAKCDISKVVFCVAGQGDGQVKSHMNSITHKLKSSPAPTSKKTTVITKQVVVQHEVPKTQKQQSITGTVLKDNVTKAEILWVLETALSHYSHRSSNSKKKLITGMFPDSEIAQSLAFGKTKINYMVTTGIATYFKDLLLSHGLLYFMYSMPQHFEYMSLVCVVV